MNIDTSEWKYIEDSAHAWLVVKEERVRLSGYNPTEFSFRCAGYAYLEEDLDAPEFLRAIHSKLPDRPKDEAMVQWYRTLNVPTEYIDGMCYVRELPRYKPVKSNT